MFLHWRIDRCVCGASVQCCWSRCGWFLVQVWKKGWDLRHWSAQMSVLRRRSPGKNHTCTSPRGDGCGGKPNIKQMTEQRYLRHAGSLLGPLNFPERFRESSPSMKNGNRSSKETVFFQFIQSSINQRIIKMSPTRNGNYISMSERPQKKRHLHRCRCLFRVVRTGRFELPTSCLSSKRSKPTELSPHSFWECKGRNFFLIAQESRSVF